MINKAKEGIGLLANKLGIKDYSKYIDELDDMISNKTKMKDSIETKEIDNIDETSSKEKNKNTGTHKKLWISTGIVVASLLVVYLAMTAYFSNHFFFRTYINGISVAGKNNSSAQASIKRYRY